MPHPTPGPRNTDTRRRRRPPPCHRLYILLAPFCHVRTGLHCDAFSEPSPRHPRHALRPQSRAPRWRQRARREGRCRGPGPLAASTEESGSRGRTSRESSVAAAVLEVPPLLPWLVQWRGEGKSGYSEALRQLEFTSAFRAELVSTAALPPNSDEIQLRFWDALPHAKPTDGDRADADARARAEAASPRARSADDSALQYVACVATASVPQDRRDALDRAFRAAARRCALVRAVFRIAAAGASPRELAATAAGNGSFDDLMAGGRRADATWSVRLRRYGPGPAGSVAGGTGARRRYGKNARSPLRGERAAIDAMGELLALLRGEIDLVEPQCGIYLMEGLRPCDSLTNKSDRHGDDGGESKLLLARVIARGPKTSIYAPKTRICVTTTPLCPIASFALCNIAQLPRHGNPAVLDPFAGSCATLLAAAHVTLPPAAASLSPQARSAQGCRSVAIEIAHNGHVNREAVLQDFAARSLPPPAAILRGDCLEAATRARAREAIGGGPFDIIVTDPPYGIREALDAAGAVDVGPRPLSPLARFFRAMGEDRAARAPLLRPGGRLVAFVPVRKGERLVDCVPDARAREAAGLLMEGEGKEQVLSDYLSRWLVSFVCV